MSVEGPRWARTGAISPGGAPPPAWYFSTFSPMRYPCPSPCLKVISGFQGTCAEACGCNHIRGWLRCRQRHLPYLAKPVSPERGFKVEDQWQFWRDSGNWEKAPTSSEQRQDPLAFGVRHRFLENLYTGLPQAPAIRDHWPNQTEN